MEKQIKIEITITMDEDDYNELNGDVMEFMDGILSNHFSCAMVTGYSEGEFEGE